MIDPKALLIAGAILICVIAIFVLWLQQRDTKKRIRRLEDRK